MTKLILCFDGTSNDPGDAGDMANDGNISNILKMHAFFGGSLKNHGAENPRTPGQRSFYYSGVGTRGGLVRKAVNAMCAPAYGDMGDIIEEAKGDLNRVYQDGDGVYIFGFSRGAAIARQFSAKISEHCPRIQKVRFLGVYDTVAAIRGSRDLCKDTYPASDVLFEDGNLGGHIEAALHLVAIDEKRLMFQPTLFNKRDGAEEIWFSGAHSDVGGGFWKDGLSDIALEFMLEKCKAAGLLALRAEDVDYGEFPVADEEEARGGRLPRPDEVVMNIPGPKPESDKLCPADVEIKPDVCGKLHGQKRVILKGTLAPRTLRVMEGDKITKKHLPIVHYTALERVRAMPDYNPAPLRKKKFKILHKDGRLEEYRGIAAMRQKPAQ